MSGFFGAAEPAVIAETAAFAVHSSWLSGPY